MSIELVQKLGNIFLFALMRMTINSKIIEGNEEDTKKNVESA